MIDQARKNEELHALLSGLEDFRIAFYEAPHVSDERLVAEFSQNHPPPHHVRCSGRCNRNGGYELGDVVTEMIQERQSFANRTMFCDGEMTSPAGMKVYAQCEHVARFEIMLRFAG